MAAGQQIEGQMNALDFMTQKRKRPCEYDFFRYIGQRVCVGAYNQKLHHGTIVAFDDYYTEIRDDAGKEWVGTPTSTMPEEKWREKHDGD